MQEAALKMRLKTIFRGLPDPLRRAVGKIYGDFKIRRAKEAYKAYQGLPSYLLPEELSRLMKADYRGPDVIRYDPEGLSIRAREKLM